MILTLVLWWILIHSDSYERQDVVSCIFYSCQLQSSDECPLILWFMWKKLCCFMHHYDVVPSFWCFNLRILQNLDSSPTSIHHSDVSFSKSFKVLILVQLLFIILMLYSHCRLWYFLWVRPSWCPLKRAKIEGASITCFRLWSYQSWVSWGTSPCLTNVNE